VFSLVGGHSLDNTQATHTHGNPPARLKKLIGQLEDIFHLWNMVQQKMRRDKVEPTTGLELRWISEHETTAFDVGIHGALHVEVLEGPKWFSRYMYSSVFVVCTMIIRAFIIPSLTIHVMSPQDLTQMAAMPFAPDIHTQHF
jgi:hypothetical protein